MDIEKEEQRILHTRYRYNSMAETYEAEVKACGYSAPSVTARKVAELFNDFKDATVIDMGGGTGMFGEELTKYGFQNIDILDISTKMLDIARSKRIYRNIIQADINEILSSSLYDDTYDVVVACGVHGPWEGAFSCEDTDALLRITKKGGYVFITTRTEYLFRKEYRGKLIPKFEKLEQCEKWIKIHHSYFQNYVYGVQGELYVYKKID